MRKNLIKRFQDLRLGADSLTLAAALAAKMAPRVRSFMFNSYLPKPGAGVRLQGVSGLRSPSSACASKSHQDSEELLLFRKALLSRLEKIGRPRKLTEAFATLLNHDPQAETKSRFKISHRELSRQRLEKEVSKLMPDRVLALASRCRLAKGNIGHIPMMDFNCLPSARNQKIVKAALNALGQKRGVLLNSGRSFHYCGFDALTQKRWYEFLSKSLLLAPLTDARYIAHRLWAGTCSLRLSSAESKPRVPRVIAFIGC